jgi:hypothetical protein
MLLCPRYKKCKVKGKCIHRIPHEETTRCTIITCGSTPLKNIVCMEELYAYMKDAINDRRK